MNAKRPTATEIAETRWGSLRRFREADRKLQERWDEPEFAARMLRVLAPKHGKRPRSIFNTKTRS
jgi:hypothetical protein